MRGSIFWNDALKYGAILGVVMSLSMIFEHYILYYSDVALGKAMTLYLLEWVAVVGIYIWLLYRFTKNFSNNFEPEEGFSFVMGIGFAMTLNLLVAVIVGMASTIFYSIAGFEGLIEGYIGRIDEMMSTVGDNNLAMQSLAADMDALRDNVRAMEQPSMLMSIVGTVSNYVMWGIVIDAIIALVLRRKPVFVDRHNDEE